MNKILLLLLLLVSITQSESVEQGIGIAAETHPAAQPLVLTESVARSRRKWTKEEDARLTALVEEHGTGDWAMIASLMPDRNIRQCRERWTHYLNPEINKDPWTKEEDEILLSLYEEMGPQWKKISKSLNNRSPYAIRNRTYLLIAQQQHLELINKPTPQPLGPQHIPNSQATAATTAATAELSYDAFHIVGEQEAPLALVSIDQLLNCKISINTHIAPAVTAEPSYDAFHIGGDDLDPFACMSTEEQGDSYGY